MKKCEHCGTEFLPHQAEEKFCCAGCAHVNAMILGSGHHQFYDFAKGRVLPPVQGRVIERTPPELLEKKIAEAEAGDATTCRAEFGIEGASCVACVWLVDTIFQKQEGAVRAVVHVGCGKLELHWRKGKCDVMNFFNELAEYGYRAVPTAATDAVNSERRGMMMRLGLCGAFAMNTMAFMLPFYVGMNRNNEHAGLFLLIAFVSATLSMLIGGTWFMKRAWMSWRAGIFHMDMPIATGLILAYAGSVVGWFMKREDVVYFDFVSTFVFLMLLGRIVQLSVVDANRKALGKRQVVAEKYASADGLEILLDELKRGSNFLLDKGKVSPVVAVVDGAGADFSLEWINGEADPMYYGSGMRIPAGAVCLARDGVTLRAEESWTDSLLERLVRTSAEKSHAFLDRLLRCWMAAVSILGLSAYAWYASHGMGMKGFQVMISVFVVSCPCALGLAIPLADDLAAVALRKVGLFLRNHSLWSRLAKVHDVVFDKTGTLTMNRPRLSNAEDVLSGISAEDQAVLVHLTSGSLHPICRALMEELGHRGMWANPASMAGEVREEAGLGLVYEHGDSVWKLGRPRWCGVTDACYESATLWTKNGEIVKVFRFAESPRPDAAACLHWLRGRKYRLHVLSGDAPEKVDAMCRMLGGGFTSVRGGLLPDEKAQQTKKLGACLYVGDGANDSLAFDEATVTGTPLSDRGLLECKADFYMMGHGISGLVNLFKISQKRRAAVRSAFIFALCYNIIILVVCLLGFMAPWLAAILMPISSIICMGLVWMGMKQWEQFKPRQSSHALNRESGVGNEAILSI
ncbi:MAG: heavy metal translocating P-type ATPase metal-binding domain-containing protein [Akkermansiaceae bacterium]